MAAGPSSMVYIRFMWVLYAFHVRRFVAMSWYELVQPFSTLCPFSPFSLAYSDSTATGPSSMVYICFLWVLYAFYARRFVPMGWYELVQPFSTLCPFLPLSLAYSDSTAAGPSSMVYICFMWVLYAFYARCFVPMGWYKLVQPFSVLRPFWHFSLVYSDSTAWPIVDKSVIAVLAGQPSDPTGSNMESDVWSDSSCGEGCVIQQEASQALVRAIPCLSCRRFIRRWEKGMDLQQPIISRQPLTPLLNSTVNAAIRASFLSNVAIKALHTLLQVSQSITYLDIALTIHPTAAFNLFEGVRELFEFETFEISWTPSHISPSAVFLATSPHEDSYLARISGIPFRHTNTDTSYPSTRRA